MRKLSTILISILAFITVLMLIISISLQYIISKKSITKMIEKIEVEEILKNTQINDELYSIANSYQMTDEEVQNMLSSKETKDYISSLIEKFAKQQLEKKEISKEEIFEITSNLFDTLLEKKYMTLSNNTKEKFSKEISNSITNHITQIQIESNLNEQDIFYTLTNSNTKAFLVIIIIIELISIIAINWPQKNFFIYLGCITLSLSISIFLFLFIFKIGLHNIFINENNQFISLFEPLITSGYKLNISIFVITIIFFITHIILKKQIQRQKEVPF